MSSRQFHLWVGILLALPMFIVGVTAVFIAHNKSMGLKDLPVPGLNMSSMTELELRSSAQDDAGQLWLGSAHGLFVAQADGSLQRRADLDVRQLLVQGSHLWIASKSGLYQLSGDTLELRLAEEVQGISRLADGQWLAAVKDVGALTSADGRQWQPWSGNQALRQVHGQTVKPYTFGKLVMDLHTGKAIFGKAGEWVWIDLLGVALAALGLTGVWVWWQTRRRAAL